MHLVSRTLLIPYDPQRLAAIFAEQLPKLGIELAYVAIRASFAEPTEDVRLIIHYDQRANLAATPVDCYYKAAELASNPPLNQDQQLNLILVPLYSADIYAGFALFSFGPRIYQFYTQLGSALGYSIVNSFLLEQVRTHAQQLEEHVKARTIDLITTNGQLQREIAERKRMEEELKQARDLKVRISRHHEP